MKIHIGKTGTIRDVDFDSLTASVKEYIVNYGLTQILNDAHSSVTKISEPDDDKRKAAVESLVDKKLAALLAGEVRTKVMGPRDPVRSRAIQIALRHCNKIKNAKDRMATARRLVEAKPSYMLLAAQQIEMEKAMGEYDPTADTAVEDEAMPEDE